MRSSSWEEKRDGLTLRLSGTSLRGDLPLGPPGTSAPTSPPAHIFASPHTEKDSGLRIHVLLALVAL